MRIPFLDLRRQYSEVEAEVTQVLARVLGSGSYILAHEVEAFEAEWARFCGVRGAVAVNSGTDALTLALIASGALQRGEHEEVITSPLAPGYTALAIIRAGGVPVFADIDPRSYTLDPQSVEKAITRRTRAVMPVHLYGQMADMKAICALSESHNLTVIEDAAQAHGTFGSGKRAGAHGHAAAFSFYPTKNLGAYGDGGVVVSDDAELLGRVRMLRQGGHYPALQTNIAGVNSRLDEVQAAILRVKLKFLEGWNARRNHLASVYSQALTGTRIETPSSREAESHNYHLYVVQHPERERLRARLAEREIETIIHYPSLLHQQPLFRRSEQHRLPVAERVASRIFSLPLYPQLSDEEAREVADTLVAHSAQ